MGIMYQIGQDGQLVDYVEIFDADWRFARMRVFSRMERGTCRQASFDFSRWASEEFGDNWGLRFGILPERTLLRWVRAVVFAGLLEGGMHHLVASLLARGFWPPRGFDAGSIPG